MGMRADEMISLGGLRTWGAASDETSLATFASLWMA